MNCSFNCISFFLSFFLYYISLNYLFIIYILFILINFIGLTGSHSLPRVHFQKFQKLEKLFLLFILDSILPHLTLSLLLFIEFDPIYPRGIKMKIFLLFLLFLRPKLVRKNFILFIYDHILIYFLFL